MVKRKPVMPPLLPNIADPTLILGSDSPEGDTSGEEEEDAKRPSVKAKPAAPAADTKDNKAPAPKAVEPKTETVAVPPQPEAAATPAVVKEQLDKGAPASEATPEAEVAVILSGHRFYPARIRLKEGQAIKLVFTTLNKKAAALVMEQLQVQRWIAKEDGSTNMESETEITRELSHLRITEISLRPKKGTYSFHDALSGAVGEIVVE